LQGIGFEPQAAFEHALEQKFPTSSGRDGRSHITGENSRDKSRRLESNGGVAVSKPDSAVAATLHSRFAKGTNDLDVRPSPSWTLPVPKMRNILQPDRKRRLPRHQPSNQPNAPVLLLLSQQVVRAVCYFRTAGLGSH
jgi:hypothetical protein